MFEELKDLDRAITNKEEKGFIKVIISKKDKILGCTIASSRAGEMIGEYALAMKNNLKISSIYDTIHAYPSYIEINKSVIGKYKLNKLSLRIRNILNYIQKIKNILNLS